MDDDAKVSCNVCGRKENLKQCARCKSIVYCCREHQIKDWLKHKPFCSKSVSVKKDGESLKDVSSLHVSKEKTKQENESGAGEEPVTAIKAVENTSEAPDQADKTDYFDFDKRPLKETNFPKAQSKDPEFLAKFATDNLISQGFCVVDEVFSKKQVMNVVKEMHELDEAGKLKPGQLAGGRTSTEDEKKVTRTDIRSDKILWMEGNEGTTPHIADVIKTLDTVLVNFNKFLNDQYNIGARTKAMVACYPGNGTYYRRHVDNPNKDGRLVTCILYLNQDWDVTTNGGVLRIFPANSNDYVDIAPIANRLLFFWSDWRNPHEVQPAYKTRYALTVWYFDQREREKAKEDYVKQEMSKVRGEHGLHGTSDKIPDSKTGEEKIEEEATKAVMSLTLGEIQAIAELVKDQPDKRATLTKMGIASHIQTVLLKHIEKWT